MATSGPAMEISIEPFGDAALLLTLGPRADPALAARAQVVAQAVAAVRTGNPAIGRPVPAGASVLVPFDPLALSLDDASAVVAGALARLPATPPPDPDLPMVEIPVHYGGGDGPDLDSVADRHGLRPADVVELHAGASYRVLFLGFAPGFAYLGGLPAALATPRHGTPRERVPAGSVGIAGDRTAVYPLAMPGGWQLIGRTDATLFDPRRDPPALLRPGAPVRFVPAR